MARVLQFFVLCTLSTSLSGISVRERFLASSEIPGVGSLKMFLPKFSNIARKLDADLVYKRIPATSLHAMILEAASEFFALNWRRNSVFVCFLIASVDYHGSHLPNNGQIFLK